MAKKKFQHTHIPTKAGVALLGFLLVGMVLAIPQLTKNQDNRSKASFSPTPTPPSSMNTSCGTVNVYFSKGKPVAKGGSEVKNSESCIYSAYKSCKTAYLAVNYYQSNGSMSYHNFVSKIQDGKNTCELTDKYSYISKGFNSSGLVKCNGLTYNGFGLQATGCGNFPPITIPWPNYLSPTPKVIVDPKCAFTLTGCVPTPTDAYYGTPPPFYYPTPTLAPPPSGNHPTPAPSYYLKK